MGKPQQTDLANHVSGQSNKPLSKPAHALAFQQVTEEVKADPRDGLKDGEAKTRLEEYGPNEFGKGGGVNVTKILVRQFANAMTLVLLLAMAVSFGIKSWIEGGVVAFVIGMNIGVGFFQELGAEKTMDSLRSLSSPTASVVRNGQAMKIPTREVVPGDMVEIITGDTVPADVRMVEAVNFETDEALLTGESLPVEKKADATFEEDTGPGDRLNVAFSSSIITKGRGRGIVFATGMFTEIGSIAAALQDGGSKVRPVKRKEDGSAGPHRYLQAFLLTCSDALGRFLGVKVGTPLQKKLSKLALLLLGTAVVSAIIVLAANNFAQFPELEAAVPDANPTQEVAIYAVGTGLSMIPASLVVVLTITMAAGTKVMVQRHVIVRKLNALEALGGVTDICSDKTGTLTQGKMAAKKAWIPAKGTYSVGESKSPFNPKEGDLGHDSRQPKDISEEESNIFTAKGYEELLKDNSYLEDYMKVASLANLADIHETEGEWKARGDPTEIAIQVFASRFDWNRAGKTNEEKPEWKQLAEFPFDSDVKKMSVIFEETKTGRPFVFTKGAVERVIGSCSKIRWTEGGGEVDVTEEIRDQVLKNMEAIAALGLRCLALASRPYDGTVKSNSEMDRNEVENNLVFQGLIGLYDPPRPESRGAVAQCHQAGIAVHMLTGDHAGTARAIAAQVGILPAKMDQIAKDVADAMVMTAGEFDKLSEDEIDALPVLPLVVARCAPNTKVRMIEALHRRGKFCAMTGDGVNDSPSLKRADVGIAMGQAGSDVAKDASDIILTDDNFASILNAVEEGRRMFDNIQKFVLHVLAVNVSQLCVLAIGLAFKDKWNLSTFPISPVEIMWIIMICSGLPDMGLGFEKAAPDIMHRPPVSLKSGIFTFELMADMLAYGLWVAALCLGSFALILYGFGDGTIGDGCNSNIEGCELVFRARGANFACLTWFALLLAWEMLDLRRSFFRMQPDSTRYFTQWMFDVWRNKVLFWSIVFGFFSMFPILYIPVINNDVFLHEGITWEWVVVVVAGILFVGGCEAYKWTKRIYFRHYGKSRTTEKNEDVESRAFGAFLVHSDTSESSGLNNEKEKA
ncbi:MAG: Na+ ATPase [Alyxoria varia]|nr:MAG: Na+ ATPase [Alyxoria varia]